MEQPSAQIPWSDEDLLARCRQQDEAAWRELVVRYNRLVYAAIRDTGTLPADASDTFQQVWLELYRSLNRIRDPRAIPRWLIVTSRRIALRNAVTASRWIGEVSERTIDPAPGADAELVALERRHELEQALQQLGGRCEQLLRMLFYSSRKASYDELSADLGLDSSSVGPLRSRCLRGLRKILEAKA